ncbi:hypothetical protein CERSUDRAFT_96839 [Gelatoporia subvermispora B]|uniref:Protein kinase domain-containing protein n=1 Tax=Ceriporiopsis subvermispora (strain B) TaxID=914234 RepID=M2R939_CERS8|nr:hypothetical protein CERSUDRAFT_96839 [Gelatoporia subvermispora B]
MFLFIPKSTLTIFESIISRRFDISIPKRAYGAMHPRYNTDLQADVCVATDILEAEDVPYDGQPLPEFQETIVRWDDPSPDFDEVEDPGRCPRIGAGVFRVIIFDLIGTLIDRDTAIIQAVMSLTPQSGATLPRHEALAMYIGCESSRTRDDPRARPVDTMRLALRDVATRLGCLIDDCTIDRALAALRRPILYEDARSGLDLLRSKAVEIFALPLPDTLFSSYLDLPLGVGVLKSAMAPPNDLYLQISEKCDIILSRARTIYPNIRASEILLIAASTFRAIEPARAAGFQSALIARAESLTSSIRLDTAPPTYSADNLKNIFPLLESLLEDDQFYKLDLYRFPPFRIRGLWQCNEILGEGSFVYNAFHLFTKDEVAIKVDMPDEELHLPCALPYEAKIYRVLQGHLGILEPRWYGEEGGAGVMIMDRLGPNLDQLRRFCRGTFSMKTICMLALQMISRIEFAHSRGIVIRDIKPTNFAMGMNAHRNVLFIIDFGVAKLCMNPMTGRHIPFRSGRRHIGTARYSSYNSHFGHEFGRRDDIEAFGTTLLFLLHGKLPWQGIYAPNEDAKLRRIGEMKAGDAMRKLLAQSPPELTALFNHSRSLSFEDKPDYDLIRGLFLRRMQQEKWTNDGLFDWIDPRFLRRGTLLPDEYLWDPELAFDSFKHVVMPWT